MQTADPGRQPLCSEYEIGKSIVPELLSIDPYPHFRRLQEKEPVSWLPSLQMWYVVRYDFCREILLDAEVFSNVSPHSLVQDTFGEQILSSDGAAHYRYKAAARRSFTQGTIRRDLEHCVSNIAESLITEFADMGRCDFRSAFARRLPIQTTLALFGLPVEEEQRFREWFDTFEAALSNFARDAAVQDRARKSVEEFHELITIYMNSVRQTPGDGLLSQLVNAPEETRLSDDEIRRNASIIFFGGISTVEALILNVLYCVDRHKGVRERLDRDAQLSRAVVEETIRWLSPVQSATRHVTRDIEFRGSTFRKGDVVNCMLGAANRDPDVFQDPDTFNIDRTEAGRHLAFAAGPHYCLGLHLARMEACIALETVQRLLPDWCIDPNVFCEPEGYEFRQPRLMPLIWATNA